MHKIPAFEIPQFLDCAGQIITTVCCETRIWYLLPNITLSDCEPYKNKYKQGLSNKTCDKN